MLQKVKYLLQPTGKKYVTTDWTMDLCVYESIVNSLYSTISQDEHLLKNYTGLDLKRSDACVHPRKLLKR